VGSLPPLPPNPLDGLLGLFTRRRIFVSYHHGGDANYYAAFSRLAHDHYEAVEDRSLERLIDSDDSGYVIRQIREQYLTGTSCTVVLCGAGTPSRKFVDWEIKATLDKEHALVGVCLPTNPAGSVPARFLDNWRSGYAVWIGWIDVLRGSTHFKLKIEEASQRQKYLIHNSRPLRSRNG
jgi:hypothetical protein